MSSDIEAIVAEAEATADAAVSIPVPDNDSGASAPAAAPVAAQPEPAPAAAPTPGPAPVAAAPAFPGADFAFVTPAAPAADPAPAPSLRERILSKREEVAAAENAAIAATRTFNELEAELIRLEDQHASLEAERSRRAREDAEIADRLRGPRQRLILDDIRTTEPPPAARPRRAVEPEPEPIRSRPAGDPAPKPKSGFLAKLQKLGG
ncbi:MAG TPA: hypothetical protein VLF21_01270 [Candidatus Saccharimonadales bacterium]|nr:hypothetical protein [Candidatus Saccharimonadales bacterium]